MDERRTLRVSEAVREELAEIIGFEAEDPRLLAVEVTEVHVSPDGRHATVKVAGAGHGTRAEGIADGPGARPALFASRTGLPLSLRHVPELHFEQDRNPDADSRIEFLLKRAKKSHGR